MQTSPSTPAAPAPQSGTPSAAATVPMPVAGGPYTAREIYEAAQVQRRILRDQLSRAQNEREEVAQQLRQPEVTGVDRAGLEHRLQVIETRVLDLRGQLADAETRESQAAALPGSTARSPQEISNNRFEVILAVSTMLSAALLIPLVLAYARRIWRKSAVTLSMTPELDRRLDTIERAIETTAVEVERIGEGQRFVTQLMASRTAQEQASLGVPRDSR
ncbi:MAG TPA: hypothetical protein PK788_13790 [Gemmatimonadaceae bacterium]|nr:hypothetical protein [Gemmatimonadaceae bacterium]HRQ77764.1 hypothetical protein [Gemmatimonadaceae bacterium]